MTTDRPRRPAMLDARYLEASRADVDPAERSEMAHASAASLLYRVRASQDPDLVRRVLGLVDSEGLDLLARLWSDCHARTLPGTLWRLYALRDWIVRHPRRAAHQFRLGQQVAAVEGVVAGVDEAPEPEDVRRVADQILRGAFTGDFASTLDRASAFCRVLATGAGFHAEQRDDDPGSARRIARKGATFVGVGEDFRHAARLWRAGRLD